MKHFLIFASILLAQGANASLNEPITVNLPTGGTFTLGDYTVNCGGPQPTPKRYVCSNAGKSAVGNSIDSAFVRLQALLPFQSRCYSDMIEVCKRDWCAQEF